MEIVIQKCWLVLSLSKMEKNKTSQNQSEKPKDKKEDVIIPFNCKTCGLSENCHYFGKTPNFAKKSVAFFEDTFVMRDPFTPRLQGKDNFLMIGGLCHECQDQVCVGCSIVYRHRFCKSCSKSNKSDFPQEIQTKINKLWKEKIKSKMSSYRICLVSDFFYPVILKHILKPFLNPWIIT